MNHEEFLARVFSEHSLDAVASLVFDNADLIDDAFFAATGSLRHMRKEVVYESVLRAYGLLEDPEICGPREWRAIELVVPDLAPDHDFSDHRGLLTLAAPDDVTATYNAATRLAMVRYAVGRSGDEAPAFLLASADFARARILSGFPARVFDALQYARRALKTFDTLLNEPPGDDRAAIESAYIKLVNESFDMQETLRREARSAGFDW